MIAMFLPLSSLCIKMEATVVNSSRPEQRTIPALRKRASTARSELAMAPVCDAAARLPDLEEPCLIAGILHPLRISDEGCKSRLSGFLMFSIYRRFTRELFLG